MLMIARLLLQRSLADDESLDESRAQIYQGRGRSEVESE